MTVSAWKYRNTLELRLAQHLQQSVEQRLYRRARRDAFAAFAQIHPLWVASYFDLEFLCRQGAQAVAARDAEALAQAWTAQFYYGDSSQHQRDIQRVTPVAEEFLALFCRAYQDYRQALQ